MQIYTRTWLSLMMNQFYVVLSIILNLIYYRSIIYSIRCILDSYFWNFIRYICYYLWLHRWKLTNVSLLRYLGMGFLNYLCNILDFICWNYFLNLFNRWQFLHLLYWWKLLYLLNLWSQLLYMLDWW